MPKKQTAQQITKQINRLHRQLIDVLNHDAKKLKAKGDKKKSKPKTPVVNEKPRSVLCQKWLFRDSWSGSEDDGISLHIDEATRKAFVADYWDAEKKRNPSQVTPECYSCDHGQPYPVMVDAKTFRKVKRSKNGVRVHDASEVKLLSVRSSQ